MSNKKILKNKKTSWSKKHKILIITTLSIIILLGIFYAWGSYYYARNRQIDRIIDGISDPKKDLSSYVMPTNPDIDVNESKLKPLQNYFAENKNALNKLTSNLREGKGSNEISLVESGTHFLFFPKYQLRVQVYRPQVETNHPNSYLVVNGNNMGTLEGGGQNYYQDLGLVFPGRYHIIVNTKVAGRKLRANSVVNIWSSKNINMNIRTATFQVRSVPNGEIYINDHKVARLSKTGQYMFKNYPIAKSMELYVKTEYKGKTIKSEKVTDFPQTISQKFANSEDGISDYDNVSQYVGNQNKDVYQDAEGDYIVNPIWPGLIADETAAQILANNFLKANPKQFTKGKENKSYKELHKEIKKTVKKVDAKKMVDKVKIKSILPMGKKCSLVKFEAYYSFKKDKKKHRIKSEFTTAIFKNINNQQTIEKLEKRPE